MELTDCRKLPQPNQVTMPDRIQAVAQELARQGGYDPEQLEPGDVHGVDGTLPNGDPAHFMWRKYIKGARSVIAVVDQFTETQGTVVGPDDGL